MNAETSAAPDFSQLVADDPTAILLLEADGRITMCNRAFLQMFGFNSEAEALAVNFLSLLRSRKEGAQLLPDVLTSGSIEQREVEMRRPGGEAVYAVARFVARPLGEEAATRIQAYLFNDTKRKRLEQQLIQTQKMEGLGTLAGGIAHDFNNILAIILAYSTQLESPKFPVERLPASVKVIKEAVERGAALVQQLLASARQAEARFSSLDLNQLIVELEKMLQSTFPKTIRFELLLDPGLPLLTADRTQIHQVLLNLCLNARDAMPGGGTLTISTALTTGTEVSELFADAHVKQYAAISVRDTGSGMAPEVRAHVFEPFFATKERGKGTGLGLSVVYGVVHNHEGFVQAESESGRGAIFRVYLPILTEVQRKAAAKASARNVSTKIPQTILLVEDEEMLRELAVRILEEEGYRVLIAKDGIEAVEIFERQDHEIGLVVCDLGLPRLGGRDAFMQMKTKNPRVRAIVASGYLEPALRSEILQAGVLDTIQKPYDFRELLEKIRSVIGSADAPAEQQQLF